MPVHRQLKLLIAEQLNNKTTFPNEFRHFPLKGKIKFSEKYFNENILGYPFLRHSFEVSYQLNDQKYTLFLLKGNDETDAQDMLEAYIAETKSEIKPADALFININDRYTGVGSY
nr:DUF6599 family protein [uncultured Carboxylicivirga sp.]